VNIWMKKLCCGALLEQFFQKNMHEALWPVVARLVQSY
jgi:hypothetical protein